MIDKNPILKHTFNFSLSAIDYCELLQTDRKFILANQLLKSATSIGANCMEAQNAESKADFIHKIKVAAKEADETQYWLSLCNYADIYPKCEHLLQKPEEINRIIGSILSTAKKKNPLSFFLSYFIF